MPNCSYIDPLVTPYVDGELTGADRDAVAEHIRVCPPCHSRVAAERAVRDLIRARKEALSDCCAPASLRAKCAEAARLKRRAPSDTPWARGFSRANPTRRVTWASVWRAGVAPIALAASLVMLVGGAFIYQLTDKSARVMAAELAADHVKCFALNRVLGTHDAPTTVQSSLAAAFDWRPHLPDDPARAGLELVGARPCMYGEGKIAHIMYRHDGHPVSLFMLPNAIRRRELVEVLGHQAAIWCVGNRTFVLVAREPKRDVERMAEFVQASLR
jgi:anti-sigma factor RsiW